MGVPCPGLHLTLSRPWHHVDLLRNLGLHCRGVTRGERGHNYPGAESLWGRRITAEGAENPNSITSAFFNTLHLLPKDLRFEHGGAKLASCPGRHLTSLRMCCTGSIPETGFWLCKLPKSCVSYRFSIALLFSLLLFLSKLPSSITNELVKKYIYIAQRQVQKCVNERDRVCNCWAVLTRERDALLRNNSIVNCNR